MIEGLTVATPDLTIALLRIEGAAHLEPGADGSRFEELTIAGPAYVTGAHEVAIVASRLTPGTDDDALQIKPSATGEEPPRDVEVIGNDLGPGYLEPGSDSHIDSLQILGAEGLLIRGNRFRESDSQSFLASPGMGTISDIRIIDNVFEQCAPRREECNAYNAMQIRGESPAISDITVEHNTIVGGLTIDPIDGLTFRANVVTEATGCVHGVTGNVLLEGSWGCGDDNLQVRDPSAPGSMTGADEWSDAGARLDVPSEGNPAP